MRVLLNLARESKTKKEKNKKKKQKKRFGRPARIHLGAARSCISSDQARIADLSFIVAKHVGKFTGQNEMEAPHRELQRKIQSLEPPRKSGNSTTPRDGKWPTTQNAAPFVFPSGARLSRRLVLSTTAHFHLQR